MRRYLPRGKARTARRKWAFRPAGSFLVSRMTVPPLQQIYAILYLKKLRRQGLILFSLRIWTTAKAAALDERRLFGSGIGIVHELEGIIAQVLKLEAVGFVGFVVKSIQLVDGKLVELIEVRPSFSAF